MLYLSPCNSSMDEMSVNWIKSRMRFWSVERILEIYGTYYSDHKSEGRSWKNDYGVNLSACLAEAGQRVLTVDFDPQGNATSGLGLEKGNIDNTVYELLMGECQVGDCIMPSVQERLDVMPSDVDLSGAEIELLDMKDKENILKENLNLVKDNYDFIIIDCPPSLSLLTINALTAANTALIPDPV